MDINKIEDAISGMLNNKLAYALTKEMKIHGKKVKELTENEKEGILFNQEFLNNLLLISSTVRQVIAGL